MKLKSVALAWPSRWPPPVSRLLASGAAFAQAKEQFFPVLVYRTGAYAPNGTPWANGYVDYLKLVNARGGINGVKIAVRGVRDRLRHRQGRRVLRAPEGQTAAPRCSSRCPPASPSR
jgi:hypothetical protein